MKTKDVPKKQYAIPTSPDQRVCVQTIAFANEVSVGSVWRWARTGIIPPPKKIAPGTTRWRWGDVVDALEKGASAQ